MGFFDIKNSVDITVTVPAYVKLANEVKTVINEGKQVIDTAANTVRNAENQVIALANPNISINASIDALPFRIAVKGNLRVTNLFNNGHSVSQALQSVSGRFSAEGNKIVSLVGSPIIVGSYVMSNTSSTNLIGISTVIHGSLRIENCNSLTSLNGLKTVGSVIISGCTNLTSLKDIHLHAAQLKSITFYQSHISSSILGLMLIPNVKLIYSPTLNTPLTQALGIVEFYRTHRNGMNECKRELYRKNLGSFAKI